MKKNKIAAIIPTFNRRECLKELLSCLKNQNAESVQIQPIVIIDGSSDGTIEMINECYPDCIKILGDGNWWYTKCINEGIKKAIEINADYILTLNDDIVFGDQYISSLLKVNNTVNEPCVIGSVSYTQSVPHRITFSGIKDIISWRLKEISYHKKLGELDPAQLKGFNSSVNLSGRGMFFSREVVNKIGLFDQNLVQYGSDTDFSFRAYKEKIKVLISFESYVFENEKLTSKGASYNKPSAKEFLLSHFNQFSINSFKKSFYYFRKHGNIILLPIYFLLIVLGPLKVFFFKYKG